MNATSHAQLESRLHRVERENRILLALFCITIGLAFLGATRGGGNVTTADEVRIVHDWVVNGGMLIEH